MFDDGVPFRMARAAHPGYAPLLIMPATDFRATGNGRIAGRDRTPAEVLARMLLLSCLTTALPIPFVREWGVLALFLWLAARNGRSFLPHDVRGVAFVTLAVLVVIGLVFMGLRIEPSWMLYEEVPCALQVLVVMCLVPRVVAVDLDDAMSRLAGVFLVGALFLSVLALLLYFAHPILGPAMDRVFALVGSNRVAEARAALRSDYNVFAVGVTAIAGSGAILAARGGRILAVAVLMLALAVDLVSDSRRVLLLIFIAVPLIAVAWFGLWRSVLVLGSTILSGVLVRVLPINLQWREALSPRTAAFLETTLSSVDGLGDVIMRDGMWTWGLSKIGSASPIEWSLGFGFEHMLEIGDVFTDPLEPNMTYGYVHNVFLGTMLTFGAIGLACLLMVVLGAAGKIWRLRSRSCGQVLALLLASGLVMGFWSGNTVFSIPLLGVSLAVALKARTMPAVGTRASVSRDSS